MFLFLSKLQNPEDRQYIQRLYRRYRRLMFSIVREYTLNLDMQKDVVQDSVVKLIDKISTLKRLEPHALVSYIATTVRNTAINELRRADNSRVQFMDFDLEDYAVEADFSDDLIQAIFEKHLLVQIWPKLSEQERLLLEGKSLMEYSDRELAKELHCRPDSIRMMMTRARRHAIELMKKQLEVDDYDQT